MNKYEFELINDVINLQNSFKLMQSSEQCKPLAITLVWLGSHCSTPTLHYSNIRYQHTNLSRSFSKFLFPLDFTPRFFNSSLRSTTRSDDNGLPSINISLSSAIFTTFDVIVEVCASYSCLIFVNRIYVIFS